jgi:cytochrome c5
MTEAHEANDLDGPHEGPIKTPRQLMLAVFWAFVVPIFGIVLLVIYVASSPRPSSGSDAFTAEAVNARIRPVGVLEIKDMADVASMKSGEVVYAAQCAACHASGALNAPKLGDTGAWAARIKQGLDALVKAAIAGKGQMPPQGGGDHADFEIARAVVFLTNKSGASFAEPAMPTAAAATPAAPTTAAIPPPAMTAAIAPAATPNAGTPTSALSPPGLAAPAAPVPATTSAATTTAAAPAAPAAATTTLAAAAAPPALYSQACAACHIAGVAGAPKLGDKAAWAPRLPLGLDGLTASVIKGKGAMPPRGGSAATDAELKAVVGYMVGTVK